MAGLPLTAALWIGGWPRDVDHRLARLEGLIEGSGPPTALAGGPLLPRIPSVRALPPTRGVAGAARPAAVDGRPGA